MNWIDYFLGIAEQVKLKSKDRSTQIGAVIVGVDNEVLSVGYNSFPRGANDSVEERYERPEKYLYTEHAERNAIYNAARVGIPIKGSTIYLSGGLPCMDCARAVIQSGIIRVYCKEVCTTTNKALWEEQQKKAHGLLEECGVEVIYYDSAVIE